MTLEQFKNWALSQGSVGNPNSNNTYLGECVSLVQQYINKVYGIGWTPRGDAKDWLSNGNVLSYFNRVNDLQAGDIVVYGSNYGGGYGHIGIYLGNGQLLDQNGRTPRRVSVGNIYPGYAGILRSKKGTTVMTDQDAANMLALKVMYVDPKSISTEYFIGKPFKDAIYLASQTPQGKEIEKRVNQWESVNYERDALKVSNQGLVDQNAKLAEENKKLTEALKNGGTLDQATKDQISETNGIVKWIKDLLSNVFKGGK